MKEKKDIVKGIAEERIHILFRLAEEFWNKEKERSRQYIGLALRIAMRCRVKIPKELNAKYCKKCKSFLNEKNSTVEKQGELMVLKCKECGFERKMKA